MGRLYTLCMTIDMTDCPPIFGDDVTGPMDEKKAINDDLARHFANRIEILTGRPTEYEITGPYAVPDPENKEDTNAAP